MSSRVTVRFWRVGVKLNFSKFTPLFACNHLFQSSETPFFSFFSLKSFYFSLQNLTLVFFRSSNKQHLSISGVEDIRFNRSVLGSKLFLKALLRTLRSLVKVNPYSEL